MIGCWLAVLAVLLALAPRAHAELPGLTVVTRGAGAWRVVLLHGYGSPGDDLVSLADELVPRVPATFVVPASPLPWHADPIGRVWFDQHDADASQLDPARAPRSRG